MEKECKCEVMFNGYSIRVIEDYEEIKKALSDGFIWLQLTEKSVYRNDKKHLVNTRHIVSINKIGYE